MNGITKVFELKNMIVDVIEHYLNYFDFYINPNESEILNQYKEKVREGFYPKRGDRIRLSISRKAINDFKKLGTSKESLAYLLLYFL